MISCLKADTKREIIACVSSVARFHFLLAAQALTCIITKV